MLEGHAARTRPRDQAPTHLRLPTPVGEKPLHWPHVQARALGIAERILLVAGLPEHDGGENEAEGHEIRDEDNTTRLSPLKHRSLSLLGCYSFTASTPAAGALRPVTSRVGPFQSVRSCLIPRRPWLTPFTPWGGFVHLKWFWLAFREACTVSDR